jgi:uncharacterized protein (TIGR02679 family)
MSDDDRSRKHHPPRSRAALIRDRLGGLEYEKLFKALRRRLEKTWPDPIRSIVLHDLAPHERSALADLHGWEKIPSGPVKVSWEKLDQALMASNLSVGVMAVIEALGGPIAPRRPALLAAQERRGQLWSVANAHPAIESRPELGLWLTAVRENGLLARAARDIADQERLLTQALEVLGRLPTQHRLLSVLAAEATGDPHALDPGAQLTGIVLRAVAMLARKNGVPSTAAERRRLWLEVGVLCDPLSTDVLVLGLRPRGDRLARHLCESADDGEPRRITLRELTRSSFVLAPDTEVFVCENPGVVNAAADHLGANCAPLVCIEGIPSTAGLALLARVQRDGGSVRFHGDYDWWGLRIGNILAAHGATPWRFGAREYVEAVGRVMDPAHLEGAPVSASWDLDLTAEMMRLGYAVFEEQTLELLLDDLCPSGKRA